MRIDQSKWTAEGGWIPPLPAGADSAAQLVLIFGSNSALRRDDALAAVRARWPRARTLGCSTAGEILGTDVLDDSLVVTAVTFARTSVQAVGACLKECGTSFEAGRRLAGALPPAVPAPGEADRQLIHVFVLSDGLRVNGSDLVAGLTRHLPSGVGVTGGLAGDGARFGETAVMLDGAPRHGWVAAIGFYGAGLRVGMGSMGGWDPFGPERLVTESSGNILYKLDGQSALALYKQYLGEQAAELPASGLLFPLSLRSRNGDTPVVRTILAVNEKDQSLTFAGDVPQGTYAQLMKANFDRLIDGAVGAAHKGSADSGLRAPELAILISCVGRKLVLKQRVEEEVEGVREVIGEGARLAGFYSYGEISPFTPGAKCELHNQTMTITTFAEA